MSKFTLKNCSVKQNFPIESIGEVTFEFYSDEQIRNLAVLEIRTKEQLNDPRLGPSTDTEPCGTCKQNIYNCMGHFGYISCGEKYFLHPDVKQYIPSILNCFDKNQRDLRFKEEDLRKFANLKGARRLQAINASFTASKGSSLLPITGTGGAFRFVIEQQQLLRLDQLDRGTEKIPITTKDLYTMLSRLSVDTPEMNKKLSLIGLENVKPINFIVKSILVIPPSMRRVYQGKNKTSTDFVTHYQDILNAIYVPDKAKTDVETAFVSMLRPSTNTGDKPTVKELINGKKGLIRYYMLGKRNEFTARSVIAPSSDVAVDEVGVPFEFSYKLTIPVVIYDGNLDAMRKLQKEGGIASYITKLPNGTKIEIKFDGSVNVGDTLYIAPTLRERSNTQYIDELLKRKIISINFERFKTGVIIFNPIKVTEENIVAVQKIADDHILYVSKYYSLKVGDKVRRYMQDGDYVVVNRQPTLHLHSMFTARVKLLNIKTILLNPSQTTGLGAD